jgi:hypothetical protein
MKKTTFVFFDPFHPVRALDPMQLTEDGNGLVGRGMSQTDTVATNGTLIPQIQAPVDGDGKSAFAKRHWDYISPPISLDRKTYLALTTDPELVAKIGALVKEGKSLQEAINILAEGS